MSLMDIITHDIFLEVVIIFIACQVIKMLTKSHAHKAFYPKALIEDGGMPSTHTASIIALTTSIGLAEGFTAPLFFVTGAFAVLVMRDAMGVRHNVDTITAKVNEIIMKSKVKTKALDIVSGHSIIQVAAGFVLGIVGVLILHFWIL